MLSPPCVRNRSSLFCWRSTVGTYRWGFESAKARGESGTCLAGREQDLLCKPRPLQSRSAGWVRPARFISKRGRLAQVARVSWACGAQAEMKCQMQILRVLSNDYAKVTQALRSGYAVIPKLLRKDYAALRKSLRRNYAILYAELRNSITHDYAIHYAIKLRNSLRN